ncbi:MAG: hypothetical protein O9325_08765 [Roseomonas sp.]|nr:hypothetical protein [Roseomonas sp.]
MLIGPEQAGEFEAQDEGVVGDSEEEVTALVQLLSLAPAVDVDAAVSELAAPEGSLHARWEADLRPTPQKAARRRVQSLGDDRRLRGGRMRGRRHQRVSSCRVSTRPLMIHRL